MEARGREGTDPRDRRMTSDLSPRGRVSSLDRMGEGPLDVLVIGGGIVGAAVAWDASTRGLRTGLVERGDFAGGTSGKTSRMVHGGLRYLRDGRVGLVRRAVRERDLLIRNAPALVRPVRFTIPVYRGKPPGVVALRAGLLVYDLLSGGKALPRRAWMSAKETLEREPGIRSDGLEAAAIYSDATTDDVRLVLAVVQAAADAGALVANHAEVAGLRREAGRVVGATVRDWVRRTDLDIRSTVVVNATGVWIDRLRGPRAPTTVRPTKGVHVIVPRTRLGNRDAVTFHAPQDGRTMFIVPWGPLAVVGTTDTDYAGDWDHVVPSSKDVAYILESLNAAFPRAALRPEDVVSAYAGLRPLIRPRRSPTAESDISRAHRITEDPDGLLSVAGGKLTTMRLIAEDVVDRVCRRLGHRAASVTASRHLGPSAGDADAFLAMGFDPEKAAHLATRHRPEAIRPWTGEPNARERIDPGLPYVWVEVAAAVESEMAMTLVDVMVRRIGLFYEATGQGILVARDVAERMAAHLDWDAERIGIEVDDYARLVEDHRSFLRDTTQWAEVASWADSQPAGARKGG